VGGRGKGGDQFFLRSGSPPGLFSGILKLVTCSF
jgi:hypothetical protein